MDRHAGPAGVGEDHVHSLVDEALNQDIGSIPRTRRCTHCPSLLLCADQIVQLASISGCRRGQRGKCLALAVSALELSDPTGGPILTNGSGANVMALHKSGWLGTLKPRENVAYPIAIGSSQADNGSSIGYGCSVVQKRKPAGTEKSTGHPPGGHGRQHSGDHCPRREYQPTTPFARSAGSGGGPACRPAPKCWLKPAARVTNSDGIMMIVVVFCSRRLRKSSACAATPGPEGRLRSGGPPRPAWQRLPARLRL